MNGGAAASPRRPRCGADRAHGAADAGASRPGRRGGGGGGPRRGTRQRLRGTPPHPAGPPDLRGPARRPGDRRHLQPAAELAARAVDDPGARIGQARAVREALLRHRGRGRGDGGRGGPQRSRPDGGVPLSLPCALRAHARAAARRRDRNGAAPGSVVLHPAAQAERHPLAGRPRRWRADGHGLLHGAPAASPGGGGARCRVRARPLDPRRRRSLAHRRPPVPGRSQRTADLLVAVERPASHERPRDGVRRHPARVQPHRAAVLPSPAPRHAGAAGASSGSPDRRPTTRS